MAKHTQDKLKSQVLAIPTPMKEEKKTHYELLIFKFKTNLKTLISQTSKYQQFELISNQVMQVEN